MSVASILVPAEISQQADLISARFTVPPTAKVFQGHFPETPILPGHVMLAMVQATLSESVDGSISSLCFRRVKFRRLVAKAATLEVRIERAAEGAWQRFRILREDEPVADGRVMLGAAGPSAQGNQHSATPPQTPPFVDIESLIPHRRPARMVDELLAVGDGFALARANVDSTWPLWTGTDVPGAVLIELMAQTAAVNIGWRRRNEEHVGGKGIFAGLPSARILCAAVPAGAPLEVRVELGATAQIAGYAAFEGEVRREGRLLCTAHLQAVRF